MNRTAPGKIPAPPYGPRGVRYIQEAPAAPQECVTIASLSDQEWVIARTYGIYRIPACAAGQRAATLEIAARTDAIDLGDNRKLPFAIGARDIAEDILQGLEQHGVFLCAGAAPSEEELRAARERRDAWFREMIEDADVMWARGHTFREISDMHRRAAHALGEEREWAYVPGRHVDCPVCGEKIKAKVAVCRHCGAVLDAERAARHGIGVAGAQAASNAQSRAGTQSDGQAPARQPSPGIPQSSGRSSAKS